MANKKKTEDQFAQVEQALTKTEQYIEDNQKSLMIIIGAIIGVILVFIGYKNLVVKPLEKEAKIEAYMAQLYFQKDSFNLALNGDGQYSGFLDIAEDYSSTNIGNLANYYAGLCFLHTQEFDNSIEYLKNFSSDDIILSSLALGCIGDAYLELGNAKKAEDYYKDAINNSDNAFTAPRFMMKLAMIYEKNKDFSEALSLYKKIKKEYKKSQEATAIDKYISRAENR